MNKFSSYYKSLSPAQKTNLSEKASVAKTYLNSISNGYRNAGKKTIVSLMSADENINFEMFIDEPPKRRKGHVNS